MTDALAVRPATYSWIKNLSPNGIALQAASSFATSANKLAAISKAPYSAQINRIAHGAETARCRTTCQVRRPGSLFDCYDYSFLVYRKEGVFTFKRNTAEKLTSHPCFGA